MSLSILRRIPLPSATVLALFVMFGCGGGNGASESSGDGAVQLVEELDRETLMDLCHQLPNCSGDEAERTVALLRVHGRQAVEYAASALRDSSPTEFSRFAYVLRVLGPLARSAIPDLIVAETRAIDDGAPSAIQAVQLAIAGVGPPSEAEVDDLACLLQDRSWRVRRRALEALAAMPTTPQRPDLCLTAAGMLLGDPVDAVRMCASQFLLTHCVGEEGEREMSARVHEDLAAVEDEARLLRVAARGLAARHPLSPSSRSALEGLTLHSDAGVRDSAFYALLQHDASADALCDRMLRSPLADVRLDALSRVLAGDNGSAPDLDVADRCLEDPSVRVRVVAAYGIVSARGWSATTRDVFREGLAAEEAETLAFVLTSLAGLSDLPEDVRDGVLRLTRDPDETVRALAENICGNG